MNGSKVAKREGYVPRGLARTGPVLFSYGFRPFFLGAAVWAVVAMTLWIAALAGHLEVAGSYGAHAWHAHEMLFGFAPAVLAGFLLTAVPNWTGRLPVSGWPLAALFALWLAGRAALLSPDVIGIPPAAAIDGLFLPALLLICAREVIAGRKWKDLKVLGSLLALSLANACFHFAVVMGDHPHIAMRLGISAYVALVTIIGGRILPSFTVAAFAASLLHTVRLARWRGWRTWPEMLLIILHVAYAFVPLGFAAIGIGALGFVEEHSVMHVLTVGAIAAMMLAVMTRASRGHTGYALTASRLTAASYAAIVVSALLRPLAEIFPSVAASLYAVSGSAWILAFALFCAEYGPILVRKRRAVQ
ncbi:NnrS family protein [Sinorhizobium medicae]|uniref:NnrS family protein n=1 Tax=Sinorhizobium medicae TaxID=110321 RepID=UPI000C7A2AC8|nr:NnrS family protein [Sinorhizobium medicae]PLU39076.1 short-chain dehydrogenase [Sinorhizobium medicae]